MIQTSAPARRALQTAILRFRASNAAQRAADRDLLCGFAKKVPRDLRRPHRPTLRQRLSQAPRYCPNDEGLAEIEAMETSVLRRSAVVLLRPCGRFPASLPMSRANRGFPVKVSHNRKRARAGLENGVVPGRSLPRRKFQTARLRVTFRIAQHRMQ